MKKTCAYVTSNLDLDNLQFTDDGTPWFDPVNHPKHYTSHPSGVEAIQVTEHFNFCVGNAIKYLWRAGEKGGVDMYVTDLEKAAWYINREIERMKNAQK